MSKPRQYIDFKLYLSRVPGSGRDVQVSLMPTREVGESVLPEMVKANDLPPEDLIQLLEAKQITLRDLIALGKSLANCLMPEQEPEGGGIRTAFRGAYKRVIENEDTGLRLRLIIADHDLKELPWEYFYLNLSGGPDSINGFPLLKSTLSMVRHEPLLFPHPSVKQLDAAEDTRELRMALVSSLPEKQPKLQLTQEITNIKKALEGFAIDGVTLRIEPEIESATPADIANLPKGTFIFHFAGHGVSESKRDKGQRGGEMKSEGALLLVENKESRLEKRLRAAPLAVDLQNAGVRLAVFAACHSAERHGRYPWDDIAGAVTAEGIPAVVAMQYAVEDPAAVAFSEAFYVALATGLSLDEAMFAGRRAMFLLMSTSAVENMTVPIEWGVPVLYSRLPDGKLFPERIQNPGPAAAEFRRVFRQSVDVVTPEGQVIGVRVHRVKGGFLVEQTFKEVSGLVIGAEIDELGEGATIAINQDAETVSGTMIGGVIDEL